MKLQYTNVTKDKEGKDVTETREITAYTNNYERSDGIDTLGQEFTFDLADNPFDFNMMGTRLAIGGKIEFSNQVSNNNKSATTTKRRTKGRSSLSRYHRERKTEWC